MHINDLAEFMFIKNIDDKKMMLSLNCVEDNKDLFYFLLDLFCKGLVHMFGRDNHVNVHELSMEDFEKVKKKMRNAGIVITLDVVVRQEQMASGVNIQDLERVGCNLPLEKYKFVLTAEAVEYVIHFELEYI